MVLLSTAVPDRPGSPRRPACACHVRTPLTPAHLLRDSLEQALAALPSCGGSHGVTFPGPCFSRSSATRNCCVACRFECWGVDDAMEGASDTGLRLCPCREYLVHLVLTKNDTCEWLASDLCNSWRLPAVQLSSES